MQKKKLFARRSTCAILVLLIVAFGTAGAALVGNTYRFDTRAVIVPGPDGDLVGVVTQPTDGPARGLVVMVHGDGPVNATHDGLYSPWFESAADAGFATLSWSKPGIEGSSGDWLSQSMEDRAAEVSAAIDWARSRDDVPTDTIVLWGASQAGWVLPKVVQDRADVDGVVAVGTAINWLRQGRFNLLAELERSGADADERNQSIAESDETLALLEQGASYEQYVADVQARDQMTPERWGFVLENFGSDATVDLAASAARSIPVHLMAGEHDRNVDVVETEEVYRSIFGRSLSVTRVNGSHSLARPVMEDNDLVGFVTAVVWPRALLAPGTGEDYTAFLSGIGRPDETGE